MLLKKLYFSEFWKCITLIKRLCLEELENFVKYGWSLAMQITSLNAKPFTVAVSIYVSALYSVLADLDFLHRLHTMYQKKDFWLFYESWMCIDVLWIWLHYVIMEAMFRNYHGGLPPPPFFFQYNNLRRNLETDACFWCSAIKCSCFRYTPICEELSTWKFRVPVRFFYPYGGLLGCRYWERSLNNTGFWRKWP